MTDEELNQLLESSREGNPRAFREICQWLWETKGVWRAAKAVLERFGVRDVADRIGDVFWIACSELELMTSPGLWLTEQIGVEPDAESEKGRKREAAKRRPPKYRMKFSENVLGERKPLEVSGAKELLALFCKIMSRRMIDDLRRMRSRPAAVLESSRGLVRSKIQG